MKMNQPFFSIVIPTYNRYQNLKKAINSILLQDFKDFEIVISDNHSTDKTKQIVKSFKDKRIRYFKNSKNFGAEGNYKKAFNRAKGKYIFSMGDDDLIIFKDTLTKVRKIIIEKKVDFVRLNLIEKKIAGEGLRKSIIKYERNIQIKRGASSEKILAFLSRVAVGHIAGLVFKNKKSIGNLVLEFPDIPWMKIIYPTVKEGGAFFIANYYMVITWSQGEISSHYFPRKDGRLMFEQLMDYVLNLIPSSRLANYKWNYFKNYIILQPVIKLYSNNENLVKFNQRLVILEPRLKKNFKFYILFAFAFIFPSSFWKFIRKLRHYTNDTISRIRNLDKIERAYKLIT